MDVTFCRGCSLLIARCQFHLPGGNLTAVSLSDFSNLLSGSFASCCKASTSPVLIQSGEAMRGSGK